MKFLTRNRNVIYRYQVPCPRCGGPKEPSAKSCRPCEIHRRKAIHNNLVSCAAALAGCGWSSKDMALRLNQSIKTMDLYLTRAYQRFGTKANMVKHAVRLGFGLLFIFAGIATAAPVLAPTNPPPVVALAWDFVPGLTYNLYWGDASRAYTNKVVAGPTNQISVSLPVRGIPFFFAATAVSSNGLESSFSSEVSYTAPLPPNAPANMRPPLILTVQNKKSIADPVWADTGMSWSVPPDWTNAFFRLSLAAAAQPAAAPAVLLRKAPQPLLAPPVPITR